MVENGGNVSSAMRQAGYSAATAKNPSKLTDSEYVQALMIEVGLNDGMAFQQLKDGLAASKTIVMGDKEDSFVDVQPDHATRHKYLETLIRIRGIGKQAEPGTTNYNFVNMANTDQGEFKL